MSDSFTSCPICGKTMREVAPPTATSICYVCDDCIAYAGLDLAEAQKRYEADRRKEEMAFADAARRDTSVARKRRKERARELTRKREKELKSKGRG